jgi:ABC-type dipeptide/oligopeptide/nickel transport system permease component
VLTYAARRLVGLGLVLFAVLVLAFVANRLTPGDPVLMMLGTRAGDVELTRSLRHQYGLDQPLWKQFVDYVAGVCRGDFGRSYRLVGVPVVDVIKDGLAISPILALAALAVAIPVGVSLGTFAALRGGSWPDTCSMVALVAGISVPNFAMAAFLVYLFSIKLGLLPVAGWGTLRQAVLPVALLALHPSAYVARLSRTYMLEVLRQDYIRTARAKGLPERFVVYRHALRNTLVPLLTTVGILFGGLLSGTFVVETIFNLPGLGSLAIQAIFARDYPVTLAIVVLFTVFYAGINLVVDLLYRLVDPRIRLDAVGR